MYNIINNLKSMLFTNIGEERKDCYKNHVFCLNILFLTEKKNTIRAF